MFRHIWLFGMSREVFPDMYNFPTLPHQFLKTKFNLKLMHITVENVQKSYK